MVRYFVLPAGDSRRGRQQHPDRAVREADGALESAEAVLAKRQSELENEGYAVLKGGFTHGNGDTPSIALWLTSDAGFACDVIVIETESGERYIVELAYLSEAAEGYGARLWDAALSLSTTDGDGLTTAKLFLPNEQCDALSETEIPAIDTPQGLLDALFEAGALPERVIARRFTLSETSAELDLSANFGALLMGTGTAGERMYMGALVNTFLTRCDIGEITLTSAGKPIETGHAVYDEPLCFFAD